ncbi:MAG TPA: amidohydrolase [Bryobacteraceae bacterium]|jgi:hypothetical protein|nr:amidohydrolase [Bryobacteraceae bacterium]
MKPAKKSVARALLPIALLFPSMLAFAQSTTIYVNGVIVTLDSASRTVQAVATEGDRITAAGTNDEIRKTRGPNTKVVDLNGKTMLPGLIDAHSHFPAAGTEALYSVNLASPPLGDVKNIADLIAALRRKAAVTPKGQWIRGDNYDQNDLAEKRNPTREDLDKASTDHPIFIGQSAGHMGVANSLALKLAGIAKETPDPKVGIYEKDPKTGEPNGIMEENSQAVARLIPPLTPAQIQEAIKWCAQNYVSQGVTTATIAGGGISRAFWAAGAAGLVPLRIVAMNYTSPAANLPPAKLQGDEMMKTGLAIKIVHDGSIQGGYTGYLTKPYYLPYKGDKDYIGYPHETREELTALVKKVNRAGYQIAIHANGDAAIDDVIYAYREAQQDFPRTDTRFRIEHAQTAREDQLDAMKELGISPSFFVSHTYYWGDEHRDVFLGPDRAARISPLKSAINRGIRFSIHLDTPVTPMSPLQAAWSAVNRQTKSGKILGPEQRITPLQAIRAITIDAAWQEHDEKIKGSIEPGKFADFVVLAQNPLNVNPLKIRDIPVLETIVGGKTVYQK